ncbi:MAG: hypothetical protein F4Y76_08610 [Acidimicrobiales bacterium]|nr:hypothetical protein [Acidimicrobiales bacterium]MXZ15563.1 hypothetical protein [Acidimicrobiales bacterium]MYD33751.1 hypothetical protein [Acidimicrobiales bacterium]MYI09812.1 hypothetical protein [Acidimicrobiales bacterium]
MTKRPRKRLAALSAAVLMSAGSLAIFAPSASAHTATKVVNKYTCTSTYVPEFLSYENKCSFVPTTVNRPHIHVQQSTCHLVVGSALVSAGAAAAASGGPPGAAAGGLAGAAATYTVCRLVPRTIWFG